MASVEVSVVVDESDWNDLRELAEESQRNVSAVLTEAIRDDVRRCGVRLAVRQHLEDSMNEHADLGGRLAE